MGTDGNLASEKPALIDAEFGLETISAQDIEWLGIREAVAQIRKRLTRRDGTLVPAYVSVDLDVLDYFGGGLRLVELRALLAALRPFCSIVGAELREVARLSDPALLEVAAAVAYDLALLVSRGCQGEGAAPGCVQRSRSPSVRQESSE